MSCFPLHFWTGIFVEGKGFFNFQSIVQGVFAFHLPPCSNWASFSILNLDWKTATGLFHFIHFWDRYRWDRSRWGFGDTHAWKSDSRGPHYPKTSPFSRENGDPGSPFSWGPQTFITPDRYRLGSDFLWHRQETSIQFYGQWTDDKTSPILRTVNGWRLPVC